MTELIKRVAPKATPLSITFLFMLFAPLSTVQATVMADLRVGEKPGFVRLVMEFDRPPAPPPSFAIDGNRLRIDMKDIARTPSAPSVIDGITRLGVSRKAKNARIEAVFAFTPADIKTFALTGPHRFIVDAYRPLPSSAALASAKKSENGSAEQSADAIPEPSNSPASLPEKSLVPSALESGPNPSTISYDERVDDDPAARYAYHKRYQQRLIAALIAVTSIILVLLFFLIRTAGGRHLPRQQPWTHQLPETPDPNIKAIDSAIHKTLKTYDRM